MPPPTRVGASNSSPLFRLACVGGVFNVFTCLCDFFHVFTWFYMCLYVFISDHIWSWFIILHCVLMSFARWFVVRSCCPGSRRPMGRLQEWHGGEIGQLGHGPPRRFRLKKMGIWRPGHGIMEHLPVMTPVTSVGKSSISSGSDTPEVLKGLFRVSWAPRSSKVLFKGQFQWCFSTNWYCGCKSLQQLVDSKNPMIFPTNGLSVSWRNPFIGYTLAWWFGFRSP